MYTGSIPVGASASACRIARRGRQLAHVGRSISVEGVLGFTKAIPFLPHYEIQARFAGSNNPKPNSPVRIAGVEVGRVTKVEPGGDRRSALVTMRIKQNGRPIKADARARIRPRIFLEGNFVVDIEPGSPGAPELKDGGVIPLQHTATPVQFDQVFKVLDVDARGDLRALLGDLDRAYEEGAASAFNRSLRFQPDAYRSSAIVADALQGRRQGELGDLVRDLGATAAALNRNPARLQELITTLNTTAAALAREEGALQTAVSELPGTLAAAGPALDALNRAFPPVRRLAVEIRPAVRSSGPALDALGRWCASRAASCGARSCAG